MLALLAEPSEAVDALVEAGVTYQRVAAELRFVLRSGPPFDPKRGLSPNPAANRLVGCALGLAVASGERSPLAQHWLLAMLYVDDRVAMHLHSVGVSGSTVVATLRRRGVSLPEFEPQVYKPWRGHHAVEVDEDQLEPVLDLLKKKHPPGSEWRWGFNWLTGEPRRAVIRSEEEIDLDGIVVEARAGPGR